MDNTQNVTPNRESMLFCGACLSTNNRLLNIYKYKLIDAFSSILEAPVLRDTLPQHLCTYCCALLLKCVSFRDMCVRTQQCLGSEIAKGELDIESIHRLNNAPQRSFNLSITQVEITDCTLPAIDIKVEPNIDFVNIDSIIKNTDLKDEFENNDDNKISEVTAKDIQKKHGKDIKKRKRKKIDKVKKNREAEIEIDIYETDISCEENYQCQVKKKIKEVKTGIKKEKVELRRDNAQGTKTVKEVRKSKKNIKKDSYTSDFSEIENAYRVQIVKLSKEEQLEEIATRKKSRNYLESRFRCDECGKGYDAEAAYDNHLLRHSTASGPLVCEICALRFKVRCRLQKHLESHQLKFICKFDGCSFVSRDRAHAKNHHAMHAGKTFECQYCGKTFNKSTTYLTHVRLTHPAMNVACDVCGETFVSQKGLKLHKNRMHPENTKPQQYTCTTCSASFYSVEALNRHAETAGEHIALRPCEQCGENCASEDALHTHVAEKHPKETHGCEECNLTFPTATSYDVHRRRTHLGQAARRARLVARKKYAEKPRRRAQFVCEQCGRVKPNAALLRYHQRTHDGVKPFSCPQCPKAFTLKSALVWHTRTHTGEKPYQCAECPRAFSSKANFNRHYKTVHLGIRGNFPCSVCGRVFTTRSDARVHVNAVHRGLPWPKRDRKRNKTGNATDNK